MKRKISSGLWAVMMVFVFMFAAKINELPLTGRNIQMAAALLGIVFAIGYVQKSLEE